MVKSYRYPTRRIVARSVAERISEELHTKLGDQVDTACFTDESSAQTRLVIATDGILLAHIQHDPLLVPTTPL